MLIFTIDKNNQFGQPTYDYEMIRKLLKKKRIKILKKIDDTILIKFLFNDFNNTPTIIRKIKMSEVEKVKKYMKIYKQFIKNKLREVSHDHIRSTEVDV